MTHLIEVNDTPPIILNAMNHEARERIQQQVSEKMDSINVAVRDEIKAGLDLLEMVRCSVYTETLDDTEELLKRAAKKLDLSFKDVSQSLVRVADVVAEIRSGETAEKTEVSA